MGQGGCGLKKNSGSGEILRWQVGGGVEDGVDGGDEVGHAVGLGKDGIGADGGHEGFAELFAVHGKHDDADVGHGLLELKGDVGAVYGGHGEVEEDQIGGELAGHFEGFRAVEGFAANLDFGGVVEKGADDVADVDVVVGNQDALEHGATIGGLLGGGNTEIAVRE